MKELLINFCDWLAKLNDEELLKISQMESTEEKINYYIEVNEIKIKD